MPERTCSIPGCDRSFVARHLCRTHYARLQRTGSTELHPRQRGAPAERRTCSIEGCEKYVKGRDLCAMHHQRVLRHGTAELLPAPPPPPTKVCKGCGRELEAYHFPPGRRACRTCRGVEFRAYRVANIEALRAKDAERRRANRDANRVRSKAYRDANREVLRAKARARDAASKRLRYTTNFTQAGIVARVSFYGGICWICRIAPYEHLDHVKPLAAGGPNLLSNIRPACAPCNLSKGSRWPFSPSPYRVEEVV